VLLSTLGQSTCNVFRLCDGELDEVEKRKHPRSIPIRIECARDTGEGTVKKNMSMVGREKMLGLAMALHPRLGDRSSARFLNRDVMQKVHDLGVEGPDYWKNSYADFRKSLAFKEKQAMRKETQTVQTTGACYMCGRMQWL
jgi:hypothetical protein